MGLLKRVSSISQDFYPEMMGKLFVINAPMLFSGIFAIVKNWLDERTKRKITVCRGDYLKILRQFIDDDQIPAYLGGTGADDFK